MMYKKVILWILTILCMGTIFYFSSQVATDSDKTSSTFIVSVLQLVDVGNLISDEELVEVATDINHIVRKGAHFSIYALLGMLVFLLILEYKVRFINGLFCSTVISLLYACSDEIHQSFVPGRSGQLSDVMLDTAGAFCGAVLALLIVVFVRRRKT